MATLPSPSFLPTTAPAYALTTVFPPPPLGSGAPAYGHCTFPSAATYPSPHSPGGYPSYAFPFFTAPASQSHLSSPSNSPLQPLPVSTSSEFYGGQSLQAPPCGRSELQQHKDGGSDTEENGSGTAPYDCALQIENNGRDAHRVCPDSICQKGNSTYNTLFFDEKLGHKHTGPEILSVPSTGSNHSFVTQQAQTLSSLNLLHGELSKLSVLVSQFAVARGMETTEAPVTCSSRTVTPAQFKSPRTTASMFSGTCAAASSSASSRSSSDALATTYVKPHVLGEIPTPQSGYESYCYGHPNQIQSLQSSRVHCGSTNLGEQNQIQSLQELLEGRVKMVGSFITRALILVLGYAYPAYDCYKTVELNRPEIEQLRFWCQYWILLAMLTVFERVGDNFISWLPMYSEAKHESEIDRNLLELRTRASDIVVYFHKVADYSQTRFHEILQYIASRSQAQRSRSQEMPRCYVVYVGRVSGVYEEWKDCQKQVNNFSGMEGRSGGTSS